MPHHGHPRVAFLVNPTRILQRTLQRILQRVLQRVQRITTTTTTRTRTRFCELVGRPLLSSNNGIYRGDIRDKHSDTSPENPITRHPANTPPTRPQHEQPGHRDWQRTPQLPRSQYKHPANTRVHPRTSRGCTRVFGHAQALVGSPVYEKGHAQGAWPFVVSVGVSGGAGRPELPRARRWRAERHLPGLRGDTTRQSN